MPRSTITILAAAAAVGIVTAVMAVALATATISPARTSAAFHERWNAMDDGERFAACLDVWEHGAADSAHWVAELSDQRLHAPTIATELDAACT